MNPLFCSLSESNHPDLLNTNLINNSLPESAVAASQAANKLDSPKPPKYESIGATLSCRLENWLHGAR